ncbi:nitrogenase iron-molybdenum cofactor biosynthesis protein NifE, partial [Rhizobium ruizarguesonis]
SLSLVVDFLMDVPTISMPISISACTMDKERIKQMLKDENHLHQSMAASELYAMLREHKPDIMLSGGSTQFVALEAKIPWLDVNQERQHA